MTKFFKRCWMILAFLIITAALISSLFRALTPWAKQYKSEIERRLSLALGESVTIDTMETGWYWFEPVIKLNQVSIFDGKQEAVKLSKLLMGINLFSSLWHWQLQPGVLLVEDLHLGLHQREGSWQIDGITGFDNSSFTWDKATFQPLLAWVLDQQKIIIKNFSAHISMLDGSLIPLSKLNLKIVNRANHYHIKGRAYLAQTPETHFQLLADLALNPYALDKTTGQIFFSAQNLLPAQWQGFFAKAPIKLENGKGHFELWAEFAKGALQNLQTKVHFQHLTWINQQSQKKDLIQTVKANLAWQPTQKGWQLTGDQLHLRIAGQKWPENSFLLSYQNDSQAYFLFIKELLLESLLASSLTWPDILQPILAVKPHGQFHDTQIQFKLKSIDSVLTRFSNLGWMPLKTRPGVKNLAGVIQWQPKEGRLELAGKRATISQVGQKSINLAVLDAAFDWQELEEGLRVNMERFVINHPNLLLSAKAVIDKVSANSSGQIDLTAVFSANQAQRLLPYIPGKHLKKKLEIWLKRDIKRIGEIAGDLVVQGNLADFPFDKQAGEFKINSHFKGIDLIFAPNWSVTKDLQGYLRINKRNLEADIVHANLKGVIVDHANLRVDEIGLDREVLLFHTLGQIKAEKALAFILASPLHKKLEALSLLKMRGLLNLDLRVEAPLYPENDTILALGEINFNNNQVDVHHSLDEIELRQLKGSLQFNQSGILNSNLHTMIHNFATNLSIRSINNPIPYTEIKLAGKAEVKQLNEKFNLAILSLTQGSLMMHSTLKLTDDPNDLDHLRVQTSLEGLAIDLPPPFGKEAKDKAPLTVDIDFNPEKAVKLRFNYADRLSSDLWFSRPSGSFQLEGGEIRVGSGKAQKQNQQGIQIVGSLPYFDLHQWLAAKAKLPELKGQNAVIEALNLVDLKLKEAKLGSQKYNDLALRATKLSRDDWLIKLNQESIAAKLHYQPLAHNLSGQFEKLHIGKAKETQKPVTQPKSSLKPMDIPNLNLRVDSFQWGDFNLGAVNLKTKSTKKLWKMEYCKIQAPSYALELNGEWKQQGAINSTTLVADLHMNDLAASLQRWKISPAVEAKSGTIQFQGGWPDAFPDFQLARVKGQVKMDFKEGRITNLSPETEEKLGLGKLLSILSLQTIPRRLKLDFSDLSSAGYSFDKFQGHFEVHDGIMTTEDSYIDGPVAYASMKGSLDIVKQNYDVDLKISPHITASLPVVATIAGGPVVGFATWVAAKIINQGMQKISGYSYKVTGPWREPSVQQLSIIKKRRVPLRA